MTVRKEVPSRIEVARLLRRTQLRKQSACETALNQTGMTLAQWGMLHAVAAQPESSTHSLALFTGQSDQSAGAVVARLQRQGLIERHAGGGKAILHRITADGARQVLRCDEIVAGVMDRLLTGLADDDLRTLEMCLTAISEAAGPTGLGSVARHDRSGLSGARPADLP